MNHPYCLLNMDSSCLSWLFAITFVLLLPAYDCCGDHFGMEDVCAKGDTSAAFNCLVPEPANVIWYKQPPREKPYKIAHNEEIIEPDGGLFHVNLVYVNHSYTCAMLILQVQHGMDGTHYHCRFETPQQETRDFYNILSLIDVQNSEPAASCDIVPGRKTNASVKCTIHGYKGISGFSVRLYVNQTVKEEYGVTKRECGQNDTMMIAHTFSDDEISSPCVINIVYITGATEEEVLLQSQVYTVQNLENNSTDPDDGISESQTSTHTVLHIVIAILVLLLIAICLVCGFLYYKLKENRREDPTTMEELRSMTSETSPDPVDRTDASFCFCCRTSQYGDPLTTPVNATSVTTVELARVITDILQRHMLLLTVMVWTVVIGTSVHGRISLSCSCVCVLLMLLRLMTRKTFTSLNEFGNHFRYILILSTLSALSTGVVSERCMQQYGLKNICAREGTQSVFSCLSNDDVTWTWHPVNGTETAILDQDQFKKHVLYLNSTHSCSLLVIDVNDDMNNDWYSCGFNDHKYWGRLRIAHLDRSNLRAEVRVAERRSPEGTEVTMTYVIMGFSATPGLHLYLHINDELVKEEPTGRLECIPEDSVTLTYTKVIQQEHANYFKAILTYGHAALLGKEALMSHTYTYEGKSGVIQLDPYVWVWRVLVICVCVLSTCVIIFGICKSCKKIKTTEESTDKCKEIQVHEKEYLIEKQQPYIEKDVAGSYSLPERDGPNEGGWSVDELMGLCEKLTGVDRNQLADGLDMGEEISQLLKCRHNSIYLMALLLVYMRKTGNNPADESFTSCLRSLGAHKAVRYIQDQKQHSTDNQ